MLTLVGLGTLVWLCEARPLGAAALGWWWGLGHFAAGLTWIAEAFTYQAKMPAELGWVAVAGLSALLATMPAIACALTWRLAQTPAARMWLFPVAWMLTEWTRSWLFTGFPWNPLAAASLDPPALAHLSAWIGALGVSGLVALFAAAFRFGEPIRMIVAFALLNGAGNLSETLGTSPAPPGPELVIVQPNIGQGEKWDPTQAQRHLATLMSLSRSVAAPTPGRPRIHLWPETALPQAELELDIPLRATLATLLRPGDLLLTGGLSVSRDATGTPVAAANSLFAIDSGGRIVARYDKHHLVPGGEYVPLRPLADALGLSRLAPGALDFTPGPGPRTLTLPGLPAVGPMICYEMIFAARIVDRSARPTWLVNPSNDAWFGGSGPPQHLALARLRAIEEGLPIARSTPTGVSALIDARGRLLATIAQGRAGALLVPLPGALPPTPFARFGHLTSLALALAFFAAALWAERRRKPAGAK